MYKSPQSRKSIVLVVDDDSSVLEMLENLFRGDVEIVTANGGQMALAMLRENIFYGHMPDLILADVHMRCGSGPTFLDNLKSIGVDIPVLLTVYLSDFRMKKDNSTIKFERLREEVLRALKSAERAKVVL